VRPAIALIMIGTNDSGSGSPDVFAGNLRQIVQTTIDMGIVPVLSTIPPKNLGDEQNFRVDAYNAVIRQVAAQYDVPLWDYFSNMASAPNRGMHPDGLHPSQSPLGSGILTAESLNYGYTIRNLNALQVLDAIWRYVMY
jgi:lysophospholipase L1-like esterase